MLESLVQMLDRFGSVVFWTCAAILLATDLAVVAIIIQTRSREFVNRWTGRVLAANVLLLGAGLGVPAAAYVTKAAVLAVAPTVQGAITQSGDAVTSPAK